MVEVKILGAAIHGLDMVETLCCIDSYINLGRENIAAEATKQKAAKEAKAGQVAGESKTEKTVQAVDGKEQEKKAEPGRKVLHHIITLNAEILYHAQSDDQLMEIIHKADLITPDGSGIVWAAKELAGEEIQRVTGIDLMQEVCRQSSANNWHVFLFGGKPGVADEASKKLEETYNTKVVGMAHGYFRPEDEEAIIERINASGADILFVALGAPKQEFWIDQYRDRLKVPVVIGVGGSFDVIAGTVKRAPVFFQKLGIEFLWRLIKEPWRFKRMMSLPKFMRLVKQEVKKKKKTV